MSTRKKNEREQVMGMAASQARFLGLTARQNNVEYEGQQVNQQRTTLANQSANYYNQLLGMSVPVPPSTADYTKTVYTFEDGNLSNSVTSLIAQQDGTYLASYVSSWTNDFAPVAAGSAIITREKTNGAYNYYFGSVELRNMSNQILSNVGTGIFNVTLDDDTTVQAQREKDPDNAGEYLYFIINADNEKQYITPKESTTPEEITEKKYTGNDAYLKTLSVEQIENLQIEEQQYITQLNEKYGTDSTQWLVRYVQNTSTGTWSPVFLSLIHI